MASETGKKVQELGIPVIGESGIFTPEDVKVVQDAGCKGILVGESIVKQGDHKGAVETLLSRK
jgi:indole-3-glycerol phosphate synthase